MGHWLAIWSPFSGPGLLVRLSVVATEVPVKMDLLGPVILNDDGSMRRIANWLLGEAKPTSGRSVVLKQSPLFRGPWWLTVWG